MNSITKKEKQILNSHREILWLQRQIEEYEQEEDPDFELPETITEQNIDEHLTQYSDHISELRSEVDLLAQLNQLKEKLASNIDAQYFTEKALYPKTSNQVNLLDKLTEEKINERDAKVVEFFNLLKQFTVKKYELTRLQSELIQQHIKNKETIKEIQELKQNDFSKAQVDHQTLSQGITESLNHLSTVRGVLLVNAVIPIIMTTNPHY
ncbi:hypothetical protein G6F46_010245 [Rhizopus delemar]|uniref:Uncharacterized protein n=3 Tax=Rhizopus TaxID=4842 RepID=I1CHQ7_RHIO9|nr:hypothetical protein RO3G_12698 [Rhizopus delemar RA 99-880]KAG1458561.1 hypothetical protein G6F55_005268 [Rhizopus delemar]KAG1537616.1 hypothetical protein G6F51_010264 [Rhizopus arrhizus]KAG1494923.1 hypothetical protein G6F54_007529 [Rhizopus delemar]KAG1505517.1 hypothetical protein G6F53_010171 [Rhizopus delemar]|eukprot:EIE87987.1 hypothetical protein RO3G_12698 [Rhizopus delemar RA 99-880]